MIFWLLILAAALYAYYRIDKYFHDQRIDDVSKKCVFVTGCDTGFGSILPVRLDAYGVTCFAGCLTQAGVDRLKEKCSSNVKPVLVDVASSESIRQAYDFVKANIPSGKEFWAVLNNAGIWGADGPLEFMTREDIHKVFDINFVGQVEVARIFLPLLKRSKGRIVNVSSCLARFALPINPPYVSSKWALEGFSDALRREKAVYGISVSIIEPGLHRTTLFDTDAWDAAKEAQWQDLPDNIKEEYGNDYLDDAKKMWRDAVQMANPDFTPVIDAYDHALFSKYPRCRYPVGTDGKICHYIGMLPDAMTDFVLAKISKLPKPKVLR